MAQNQVLRELLLIRHAPALNEGRLAGHRDVPVDPAALQVEALRALLGPVEHVIVSPALRCCQTAQALWPDHSIAADPRLWEQDFGAWEDMPLTDLPDLGPLPPALLAAHTPPQGESFAAMCARVAPALAELARQPGRSAIVAHAGTVRAALALAMGDPGAALAFGIDPLSVTSLIPAGDQWAVAYVNRVGVNRVGVA